MHVVEHRFDLAEEWVWDGHPGPKILHTSLKTSFIIMHI